MLSVQTFDFIATTLIIILATGAILWVQHTAHETIMKELKEIKKDRDGKK